MVLHVFQRASNLVHMGVLRNLVHMGFLRNLVHMGFLRNLVHMGVLRKENIEVDQCMCT